jgi:hypothetical protein
MSGLFVAKIGKATARATAVQHGAGRSNQNGRVFEGVV